MVPDSWKQAQLGDVIAEFRGGGTPSRKRPAFWGGPIPWASVKDLNGNRLTKTDEFITQEGLDSSSAAVVPAGTVVVATRMAVGRAVTADMSVAINQDLKGLLPGPEVTSSFLQAWLNWREDSIAALASGTTVKGIRLTSLRSLPIALPPLTEQRKIAAILSSVDDAIAATRKVIEQTKRVKQGLLHTLMTRGIGHTRFKKTEIGEIPDAWELVSLESLLAASDNSMRSGPFGSALLKKELVREGIPLLGIDNIHEEEFRATYSRFVSPEKFQQLKRYAVRARDVVITIMGTVGRTCVIPPDTGPALSSKHLWTMTFDQDRYIPELVSLQLNWAPWVQHHFKSRSQGGIMKAIRSDVLKTTPLPLPPMEEQTQIAAILESCRSFQRTTVLKVNSLEKLKRGLMQDLLTGRVRVQPD